jgi:hypothetical protein
MRNSLKGVVSRVNRIASKAGQGSRAAEIYAERRRILGEGRQLALAPPTPAPKIGLLCQTEVWCRAQGYLRRSCRSEVLS